MAERFLGESFIVENPAAAAGHLEVAVQIFEDIGARNEVAKVLVAQANLCRVMGNPSRSRQLLECALTLFEALGTLDEPNRVWTELSELSDGPLI